MNWTKTQIEQLFKAKLNQIKDKAAQGGYLWKIYYKNAKGDNIEKAYSATKQTYDVIKMMYRSKK